MHNKFDIKCWFGYERSRVDGHWQPVIYFFDPNKEQDHGNGKRPERSTMIEKTLKRKIRTDFALSQWMIEHPEPKDTKNDESATEKKENRSQES